MMGDMGDDDDDDDDDDDHDIHDDDDDDDDDDHDNHDGDDDDDGNDRVFITILFLIWCKGVPELLESLQVSMKGGSMAHDPVGETDRLVIEWRNNIIYYNYDEHIITIIIMSILLL